MENQKSNTCILVQEMLPIYLDECLSDECKTVMETHILKCKDCKNRLDKIKENIIEVKEESIIEEKQDFSSLSKKMKHHRIKRMMITISIMCALFMAYITCFTTSIMVSNSMDPAMFVVENVTRQQKFVVFFVIIMLYYTCIILTEVRVCTE